ncbi:MAG: glutamate--tRNA ligase, partial [Caldisericota bacterium]|nr:glutamate--tRNA ligase [Caldisericota bacterium]
MNKQNKQIRVRYAPSPTGHIHIGNARSALFNYLFARHNNGVLVMRLDDTDRKRSTDEAIKTMLNDIQWLGIDWDEGYLKGGDYGPYRQTERMDLYNHYIDILLSEEKAYELYYTEEEIHHIRDSYEKEGKKFSYRELKQKETEQLRNAFKNKNLKPAIVFKVEKDEEIIVNDLVRGNVTFNSNEFKDFVIRRENGIPVYNYATVIDDALMKITHIIRAEEHLSNTPKQLFIFNALNFPPPQFAHISLILAPDRTKLSKRHGATSVGQYREMGFLPEALFNYLALLGWSSKDDREFFTKEELINLFTLESVNKAPAIFDIDKLKWMNHHY